AAAPRAAASDSLTRVVGAYASVVGCRGWPSRATYGGSARAGEPNASAYRRSPEVRRFRHHTQSLRSRLTDPGGGARNACAWGRSPASVFIIWGFAAPVSFRGESDAGGDPKPSS